MEKHTSVVTVTLNTPADCADVTLGSGSSGSTLTGSGTLSERLWVQQDDNWNVTALVNGSGGVEERYAYDPYGNKATGYGGTVHFSSSDGGASLPADSTLTNGAGTFSATLQTAGNQTITATDTVTSTVTGTSNTVAVSAAAATHFSVSAPATATAGGPFTFMVTALDAFESAQEQSNVLR